MGMNGEMNALLLTAASIGLFHTLLGPDHYLPFIVIAQAKKWSKTKTAIVTALCGIGHVLGSVLLGVVGIAFGLSLSKLELIESNRGGLAAWCLIAFGLVYAVWGLRRAWKNKPHTHLHVHADGTVHDHKHSHTEEHVHVHETQKSLSITPWVLFTIFIFGPCEPLIPMLMYPAAKLSFTGVLLVVLVFGLTTILTMLGVVLAATFGFELVPMRKLERFTHAIAGATICLCGVAIAFLGL